VRWLGQIDDLNDHLQCVYTQALEVGIPKELARLVIPVSRYSKMRASANLRNWLGFLTLRLDVKAQWEIREYAKAVGSIIEEKFPRTWQLFCEKQNK
jgi:thymidylate synthase (FAD)